MKLKAIIFSVLLCLPVLGTTMQTGVTDSPVSPALSALSVSPALSDLSDLSDSKTEWDVFVEALIQIESGGDPSVIGKNNDGGILQITPIYVREVNRLLKEEKYTLDDRFDSLKSIEMFEIIQSHYNKEKDIDKAIYYHNKKAPKSYADEIKKRMREIFEN